MYDPIPDIYISDMKTLFICKPCLHEQRGLDYCILAQLRYHQSLSPQPRNAKVTSSIDYMHVNSPTV